MFYFRNGPTVEYLEHPCGSKTTPCKPEPLPKTPDEAPLLAPGLKAPGFGTFAVVQQMGGNMASNPNTLKLDLEKILANVHH